MSKKPKPTWDWAKRRAAAKVMYFMFNTLGYVSHTLRGTASKSVTDPSAFGGGMSDEEREYILQVADHAHKLSLACRTLAWRFEHRRKLGGGHY